MHLLDTRSAELLDTWRIHSRITLYLLDAIAPEAFRAPEPETGRSFVAMFAHLHNVRLMWLQAAAPALAKGLVKLEPEVRRPALRKALTGSAKAIDQLVALSLGTTGRVKGFKPNATAFVGYLIAHESYHHGEIGIALREAGFPLDRKTAFGMWEWGVR
jgi:uncharacterized damage-inducible protein DinB